MRHPAHLSAALLVLTLLLPGSSARASSEEGLKIDAGLWQVEATTRVAMADKTDTTSDMRCLSDIPFAPERMAGGLDSCKIDKTLGDDNDIRWTMVCKTPHGQMRASGSAKSYGDKAKGTAETTMELGGQPFVTNVSWRAMRLGDCDMKRPRKPVKMPDMDAVEGASATPKAAPAVPGS